MQLGETKLFISAPIASIQPLPLAQLSILDQAQRLLAWLEVGRQARHRRQVRAAEQPLTMGNKAGQDSDIPQVVAESRMCCEDFQDGDVEQLREMHKEQGWAYDFPDLDEAQFVVKKVIRDEGGELVGAVVARKTVEVYLLGNPTWRTPRWRLEALKVLHEGIRIELARQGYADGHCWLPPQVKEGFARRLMKMFGWQLNEWRCLSRKVA